MSILKRIIRQLIAPVLAELPFFVWMLVLLDYWALYQFATHPFDWVYDWHQYPMLRNFSIAVVYSYLLTLVVFVSGSKFMKYFFYLCGVFLLCIDIFHYLSFQNTLLSSTSLILILETNAAEVRSFFQVYLFTWPGLITLIVAILLLLACLYMDRFRTLIKNTFHRLSSKKQIFFGCILAAILLFGLFSFRCYFDLLQCKTPEEMDDWHEQYAQNADRFSNLIFCFYDIKVLGETLEIAENSTKAIDKSSQDLIWQDDTTNVIFVIGESFIKTHSNIYGYSLNTNPRLTRELKADRLFAFSDVISPNAHTLEALRNLFSTNSIGDDEKWYDYPFFPAIFHQAGYRVYFWDNQDDSQAWYPFDFSLNAYLHSPVISALSYDAQRPQVSMYDGGMVDDFMDFWRNHQDGKNHLVMFHLQGQHLNTEDRYPHVAEFQCFTVDSIFRLEEWMTDEKKSVISDYDNCTLYNDSVLAQIISAFRDHSSVLVYLSDHGENVYDYGDCIGRGEDRLQLFEIPFFVWCSEKYKEKHADILAEIRQAVDRPMMVDNVCQLLMRLGGIFSSYYNKSRDVLSAQYKCPPRIIAGKQDYDKIQGTN